MQSRFKAIEMTREFTHVFGILHFLHNCAIFHEEFEDTGIKNCNTRQLKVILEQCYKVHPQHCTIIVLAVYLI